MTGSIAIAALGAVNAGILPAISRAAAERLGMPAGACAPLPLPSYAWQPERAAYDAWRILERLGAGRRKAGPHLLAVIDADLFLPPFDFIFGSAHVRDRVGVVALARLRPEYYGLPADAETLIARARKEAVHELGHTLGLLHCGEERCVMASSPSLGGVDRKSDDWCPRCRAQLAGVRAPYQRGEDLPAASRSSR